MTNSRPGTRATRWRALLRATVHVCYRCAQPLDWNQPDKLDDGRANPQYPTRDHILAYSTHPHLRDAPTNNTASHRACNQAAGTVTGQLSPLGEQDRPR
jgi:5-methylcytosine-specific restriction endonuclease McrA